MQTNKWLTDLTMWHSKWLCYQWMVSMRSLRPQQPGKEKIGQAAWLCGSHPLGCIITYLEKFLLFLNLSILPIRETVVWAQPLVIYIRYTQAKWVVGHVWAGLQDVLVEPSVFLFRDTLSEGGSIPCHSRNPISDKSPRFCLCTIYEEREMQAFC